MRITTNFVLILIAAFMFIATDAIAQGEVYRWVDENGVVHFGDRPEGQPGAEIVDIQDSNIQTSSAPVQTDSGEQAEPQQPSYAQQIRDDRAKARKEREENQRITAEACAQRRKLVSQLEPSTRVIVEYEDGTVARLDDNERLKNLNEAKTYIAENCNN